MRNGQLPSGLMEGRRVVARSCNKVADVEVLGWLGELNSGEESQRLQTPKCAAIEHALTISVVRGLGLLKGDLRLSSSDELANSRHENLACHHLKQRTVRGP